MQLVMEHILTINACELTFIQISPGEFNMGSDHGLPIEIPTHKVIIENEYFLLDSLVTQKLWSRVMASNPSKFQLSNEHPVDSVSWDEAVLFCQALSAASQRVIRLPSEAEWEYACRAATTTEYHFGSDSKNLLDYAWFDLNTMEATRAIKRKLPNAWGLYDMNGNLWEWCLDTWASDYHSGPLTAKPRLTHMDKQERRVIRGGAWDSDHFRCRSAYRSQEGKNINNPKIGFRLVLEA